MVDEPRRTGAIVLGVVSGGVDNRSLFWDCYVRRDAARRRAARAW